MFLLFPAKSPFQGRQLLFSDTSEEYRKSFSIFPLLFATRLPKKKTWKQCLDTADAERRSPMLGRIIRLHFYSSFLESGTHPLEGSNRKKGRRYI